MSNPQIVLFEDSISRSTVFAPINYTRSVSEIRRGITTPIEALSGYDLVVHTSAELAPVLRKRYPSIRINDVEGGRETILVNARVKDPRAVAAFLTSHPKEHTHLISKDGTVVGARTTKGLPDKRREPIMAGEPFDIPGTEETDLTAFSSLWNIITENADSIKRDAAYLGSAEHISKRANIAQTAVIDTTNGPVIIEDDVTIEPFVLIRGPVVIGRNTLVKTGARIYGGTTIGAVSKVSGEIEHSIISGYSNKQHDGYLGHSYIGQWCNLGAGTNTSDLRNDYGSVSLKIGETTYDTGSMFIGLLMGDHSKSAIGTQFNTGSVIGAFCNVFSEGFPPRWMPNFSWGGSKILRRQSFENALETARIVMSRRGIELSAEEEAFIRSLT